MFFSDLYDVCDDGGDAPLELDAPAAIHNLSARWLWHALTGVYPSKPDAAAIPHAASLEQVLQLVHRIAVPVTPPREALERLAKQHAAYVDRLRTDGAFLRRQLILKWWDRFACCRADPPLELLEQTDLLRAYTDIVKKHSRFAQLLNYRCTSVDAFFELAAHAIETRELGVVNPLSGTRNKASAADVLRWRGKLCVEDALRMSVFRDRQLCMQLVNAPLVVETGCNELLLDAMNAASPRAVVRVHADDAPLPNVRYHVVQLRLPAAFPFVVHFFPRWSSQFAWAHALDDLPFGKASVPTRNVICLSDGAALPDAFWRLTDDYDRVITRSLKKSLQPPSRAPSVYCIPDSGSAPDDDYVRSLQALMRKVLWKCHATLSCPLRNPGATQPADGMLLFTQFVCQYLEKHADRIRDVARLPLERSDPKGTVLVCDNRASPLTVVAAVVAMANLQRDTWRLTVVCTPSTVDFYRSALPPAWIEGTRFVTVDDYPSEKFSVQSYSTLLKSAAFWKNIAEDHCLIVQDDGMILRPGAEAYARYDYVGAPWLPNALLEQETNPSFVGNGGVSLRSTRVMEAICARHEQEARELFSVFPQELPEDVFFARFVHADGHRLCPEAEAAKFAVEQVMHDHALGFHKPWAYHHPKAVQALFARFIANK
jgi:hypothetical protein